MGSNVVSGRRDLQLTTADPEGKSVTTVTTHDKIYIDGAWVPSPGSGTIDVFDSTNGEVIGTDPAGTADDVDAAVAAARAAFASWSHDDARGAGQGADPHRRGPRRPHGRDRHASSPARRACPSGSA